MLEKLPGMTPQILASLNAAVVSSYRNAFMVIYLISVGFGICVIIAALLSSDMDHKLVPRIARKLQNNTHDDVSHEKDAEAGVARVETVEDESGR